MVKLFFLLCVNLDVFIPDNRGSVLFWKPDESMLLVYDDRTTISTQHFRQTDNECLSAFYKVEAQDTVTAIVRVSSWANCYTFVLKQNIRTVLYKFAFCNWKWWIMGTHYFNNCYSTKISDFYFLIGIINLINIISKNV